LFAPDLQNVAPKRYSFKHIARKGDGWTRIVAAMAVPSEHPFHQREDAEGLHLLLYVALDPLPTV
jgi:hypothetical protein